VFFNYQQIISGGETEAYPSSLKPEEMFNGVAVPTAATPAVPNRLSKAAYFLINGFITAGWHTFFG